LKIKIYRGTHQIGGCICGIETKKTRILVDLGKPLPDTKGKLPEDSVSIDDPYDAVIFTHYHRDHIGLMEYVAPNIPLYIGEGAKEVYRLIKEHEESLLTKRIDSMHGFRDGISFQIGDITVMPILTDHSAFDSYMLLLTAEGKSVLHTGDFRLHGILGNRVLPRLSQMSGTVDVMITEATNLSYRDPVTISESALSTAAQSLMERYPYTFILCSPWEFDRIAMFHRAAEKKERFFCDAYQMKLLETVRRFGIDRSSLYGFERASVYLNGMKETEESFCMLVRREKIFQDIMKTYTDLNREHCLFIASMSEGYLKTHRQALEKMTAGFYYRIKLHTSGHGSAEALWAAARALQPKKVIPIHTENPEKMRLGALQNRLELLEDGDSIEV